VTIRACALELSETSDLGDALLYQCKMCDVIVAYDTADSGIVETTCNHCILAASPVARRRMDMNAIANGSSNWWKQSTEAACWVCGDMTQWVTNIGIDTMQHPDCDSYPLGYGDFIDVIRGVTSLRKNTTN